jgi:hypothetical protein
MDVEPRAYKLGFHGSQDNNPLKGNQVSNRNWYQLCRNIHIQKLVTITQQAFGDSLFLADSTWCFVRPKKDREVQ